MGRGWATPMGPGRVFIVPHGRGPGPKKVAHHGSVSGLAAMLRTSASGGEQPEAENQDRQDSPRLADAAPGNAK